MAHLENEILYNVRLAIPDHPQIFQRWAEDSAVCRERLLDVSHVDLAYGTAPLERLDLFCAAGRKAPLHVFLHGGYWQAMDKSFFSFLAPAFLDAGISLAIVNYSLCPHVSLEEIAQEIKQALVWLLGHGQQYGYAGDQLHLSGHSAGGHLAAMMITDGIVAPLLASALSISGLFDLQPLLDTSINDKLHLDAKAAYLSSPAFKTPLAEVPLLLSVGELESEGFHDQSDLLARKWNEPLARVDRLDLAGCHHLSAVEQLGDPDSELFRAACSLML